MKIETKSKKQQFKEELKNIQGKVEEEKQAVKNLTQSKITLEQEIQALEDEKKKFEEDMHALQQKLTKILKDEKLDFSPKLDQFFGKLEAYRKVRGQLDESRKAFETEMQALRSFLKNPPPEAKKNLKPKTTDKVEAMSNILLMKLRADQKKRILAGERFHDLYTDMTALHQLFHK